MTTFLQAGLAFLLLGSIITGIAASNKLAKIEESRDKLNPSLVQFGANALTTESQNPRSLKSGFAETPNPTHPPKYSNSNCPLCESNINENVGLCLGEDRSSEACLSNQSCWEYTINYLGESKKDVVYKCSTDSDAEKGCEETQCSARKLDVLVKATTPATQREHLGLEDLHTTKPLNMVSCCVPSCTGNDGYCFLVTSKKGQEFVCAPEDGPGNCGLGCKSSHREVGSSCTTITETEFITDPKKITTKPPNNNSGHVFQYLYALFVIFIFV